MAMFQARHYEEIARNIFEEYDRVWQNGEMIKAVALDELARRLAKSFAKDNPNFNEARFLKAAGIES